MSDFGGKLRLARERRGISLRQIATSTKISVAALEALERNDVSKLPGGIFSRSFVRSYAIEVGLDPDETIREFLEQFQANSAPATATHPRPDSDSDFQRQQHLAGIIVKVLLIGIPLIVLVLYFTMRTRSGVPVAAIGSGRIDRVATAPAGAESPRPVPAPDSAPPHAAAPVATAGAAAAAPGRMTLEIRTTDRCWVRVIADGKRVLSRVMAAGETESRTVRETMRIDVGNAGAFAFSIDGRGGKSLGRAGQVRTINITRATASQYLQ
jgi:cytoskeleton protein RodZ